VVDDYTGLVEPGLQALGWSTVGWRRVASPLGPAEPWPQVPAIDAACIRLTKDKQAFEMILHAVGERLKPGGRVWVYGGNDEGIKSTPRRLSGIFETIDTAATLRHCRVISGTRPAHLPPPRGRLEDWAFEEELPLPTGPVLQRAYPGVFAKGRLDPGTRLLLETLQPLNLTGQVLDFAAGSGVIARALLKAWPGSRLTLIEADAVAVEASRFNVPEAEVILGDSLDVLPTDTSFDCIVANPPYHDGKERSSQVIEALIQHSPSYLRPGGSLWMVVQHQLQAEALLKANFMNVENVTADRRYKVWRATEPRC